MRIGYARVSTQEQDTALQLDALERARCERTYQEHRSGVDRARPELARMLDILRPGDTVVVYKLDRLARSLGDLLGILERIAKAGAAFESVTETIDTSTAAGRMLMQMLGAFAEFERGMICERSRAGVRAAQARGVQFGRPRALTQAQDQQVATRFQSGKYSKSELAKLYDCSLSSIKRALYRRGLDTISELHSKGCRPPEAATAAPT